MELITRKAVEVVYERMTVPIVFVVSDREDSTTPLKHHKQTVKDLASKVRSEDMLYTTIQELGLSRLSGPFRDIDEPRN
jgi:hypothetical protein